MSDSFHWDRGIPWYKADEGKLLVPTSEQFVAELQAAHSRIKELEAAAKDVMFLAAVIGHARHPTFQTLNNLIKP